MAEEATLMLVNKKRRRRRVKHRRVGRTARRTTTSKRRRRLVHRITHRRAAPVRRRRRQRRKMRNAAENPRRRRRRNPDVMDGASNPRRRRRRRATVAIYSNPRKRGRKAYRRLKSRVGRVGILTSPKDFQSHIRDVFASVGGIGVGLFGSQAITDWAITSLMERGSEGKDVEKWHVYAAYYGPDVAGLIASFFLNRRGASEFGTGLAFGCGLSLIYKIFKHVMAAKSVIVPGILMSNLDDKPTSNAIWQKQYNMYKYLEDPSKNAAPDDYYFAGADEYVLGYQEPMAGAEYLLGESRPLLSQPEPLGYIDMAGEEEPELFGETDISELLGGEEISELLGGEDVAELLGEVDVSELLGGDFGEDNLLGRNYARDALTGWD